MAGLQALPQPLRDRRRNIDKTSALDGRQQHAAGHVNRVLGWLAARVAKRQVELLRQQLRIAPAVLDQPLACRRSAVRRWANQVRQQLNVITRQKLGQTSRQQGAVGVVNLMKQVHPVLQAARLARALGLGALAQQPLTPQQVLADRGHQQALDRHAVGFSQDAWRDASTGSGRMDSGHRAIAGPATPKPTAGQCSPAIQRSMSGYSRAPRLGQMRAQAGLTGLIRFIHPTG